MRNVLNFDCRRVVVAALIGVGLALPAIAPAAAQSGAPGSGSEAGAASFISTETAEAFAKEIERELADRGARIAIVFRPGRAPEDMPEGIRYTHGAFWVLQPIETADGGFVSGYAVHNLYSGADGVPDRSFLRQDLPFDFTRPMAIAEAGIIIPTPEMQRRLIAILSSPTYAALHQPAYSLVSNPHDPRFQNCNEFMLDVIASAAWETTDRLQIKANLAAHFTPSPVAVDPFQRLFGPMFDQRLKTEDHRGGIATTTYGSMSAFMTKFGLADASFAFRHEPAAP